MRTKLAMAGLLAALIVLLIGVFRERSTTAPVETGAGARSEPHDRSGGNSRADIARLESGNPRPEQIQEGVRTAERLLDEARQTQASSHRVAPADDPSTEFTKANGRYLKEVVAPRLMECWGDVKGDGEIEFRHVLYIDGNAIARVADPRDQIEPPVSIVESSLAPEQEEKALNCMLRAVAGTQYEYVPMHADDDSGKVAIYQTWPSRERATRLSGDGAGDL